MIGKCNNVKKIMSQLLLMFFIIKKTCLAYVSKYNLSREKS